MNSEIKQARYIEDKIEAMEEVEKFNVTDSGVGWISGCIIFEIEMSEKNKNQTSENTEVQDE